MTTEQQTRLIYDELEQLKASDAQARWMAAERIAAKLGEGEAVKKSKAQEVAEKFVRFTALASGEGYLVVGQSDVLFGGPQPTSRAAAGCQEIRSRLASLLTSFGNERAAEAVAEERGRIAGEMRKINTSAYTGDSGWLGGAFDAGVGAALKIVEGVGK